MRNVLADLCLESEAATMLALRLARAYDEAGTHPPARPLPRAGSDELSDAHLFKRLATAVSKYWVCKRAPNHAFESLECLGGNGYVEESGMPRLYREAPLASIWEGSGNVMSLDVLRALVRTPRSLEVFLHELRRRPRGADRRLDAHLDGLKGQFADPATLESRARRVVRVDGPGAAGLAARAPRRPRRRRRLLRRAPGPRRAAWSTARCPPGRTSRRSSRAAACRHSGGRPRTASPSARTIL